MTTNSCAVPTCDTERQLVKEKRSVFRVPWNIERRQKWITAIPGISQLIPSQFVCEKHFLQRYILRKWVKHDLNGRVIAEELSERGYDHLTLQIGNTSLEPDCTSRHGFRLIEFFRLKPSIKEYMRSADLVISHAGAGSCLEALGERKPLIVVTNDLLMDNHQLELAQQLHNDGHLYYCTCGNLRELIATMDLSKLKPLERDNSKKIAELIDTIMGF